MSPLGGGGAVDQRSMELAQASYKRACATPDLFPAFYRKFFSACPEAKALFAKTDFVRQNRLLQHAIGLLLIFPNQPAQEPGLLTRVANRHSRRDIGVAPALYRPFVEAWIATVKEHDPEFTPALDRAWRATLEPGVAYMQSKY